MLSQERVNSGFFKGISKDREAVHLELAAWQDPVLVDGVRQSDNEAVVPRKERRGEGRKGSKGVPEEVAEKGCLRLRFCSCKILCVLSSPTQGLRSRPSSRVRGNLLSRRTANCVPNASQAVRGVSAGYSQALEARGVHRAGGRGCPTEERVVSLVRPRAGFHP